MKRASWFILFILLCGVSARMMSGEPWRMMIISDPHILAPELQPDSAQATTPELQLIRGRNEVLQACLEEAVRQRVHIVLIAGDLTKDGEKASHEWLAAQLRTLTDQGIAIYVVPGNHDIQNPRAASLAGKEKRTVEGVSPENFADIYRQAGYGRTIARDAASLSYVAQLNDSLRLLCIDACIYGDRNVTEGRIQHETWDFIAQQTSDARQAGCQMLVLMHHGLVQHVKWQGRFLKRYLVADWKKQAHRFSKLGLHVAFTGHFHAHDVSSRYHGKKRIYDVATASLGNYPMPYRMVELQGDSLIISSDRAWNIEGHENLKRLNDEVALTVTQQGVDAMIRRRLSKKITDEQMLRDIVRVMNTAYADFVDGDEQMPTGYREDLKKISKKLRHQSLIYSIGLKKVGKYLYHDTYPADNNVVIPLH